MINRNNLNDKIIKALESVAKFNEDLLDIIEVSNIKTSKIIKKKNEKVDDYKEESTRSRKSNWMRRLIIPYERSVMGVYQVKKETVKMFEELCDFIDWELRKDNSSLNKKIIEVAKKQGYYNNILYTIYCISESHVTKTYSGDFDYYNSDFSYDILDTHLGQNLKYKVFDRAKELEGNIKPPDQETLEYFKLTQNGLAIKWWDSDGELRKERDFLKEELNVLDATLSRRTKVWAAYSVKKEIIVLYLKFWEIIFNHLKEDLEWDSHKKKILENLKKGKYKFLMDYENSGFLSSLLKISENTIREVIPNMQVLNVKDQDKIIKEYLPASVIEKINNESISYKKNISEKMLKDIIDDMIEIDSNDWKLKATKIIMEDKDQKIQRLIDYRSDNNFTKIANKVINDTKDEKLIIISLYGIQMKEKLNKKNSKILEKLIHPSNILEYERMIKSKEELSVDILDKLLVLKEPIRRIIDLDMNKVNNSKEELGKTIDIISSYIGEAESLEISEDQEESLIENKIVKDEKKDAGNIKDKVETKTEVIIKETKKRLKYENFLRLLLDRESIGLELGKEIAMENNTLVNVFISDVNQELYEYIGDQTVLIEENSINIDEFYRDMVRELVVSEEQS